MYICIYLFNMYLKRFVMVTEKDLSDLLAFKWSSSWSQKHSLLSFHGFHPTQTDWHPFEFSWRESFLQRQRMTSGPQKHITTWQIPTHQPGFLLVVSPKKNSGYEKPKVIFGELGWSYIYIYITFQEIRKKKNIYIYHLQILIGISKPPALQMKKQTDSRFLKSLFERYSSMVYICIYIYK